MHELDIVTVYHRDTFYRQSLELFAAVERLEPGRFQWIGVDNRPVNHGFAKACNTGAWLGESPIIGFLNPDAQVHAPFFDKVIETLAHPGVAITGEAFGKPAEQYRTWGVQDWVCGAAMFVRRDFWTEVGGFDERFVWSWEETDLIRTAQRMGKRTIAINLPITHASPTHDHPADVSYKRLHFEQGADAFRAKWSTR